MSLTERTPLIRHDSGYISDGRSVSSNEYENRFDDDDEYIDEDVMPTDSSTEISFILKNSLPITITFFLEYSLTVTSLFVIGHLGSEKLASASLAVMTFNITGLAFFEGMATSLDTFCSQAFGARKFHKVGLYFQRCSTLIFVCSIPIVVFWWYSASVLKYVVPEVELLQDMQNYLRVMAFGAPGLILFETGKRYLQAQGIYDASTYCLAITAVLNLVLSIIFTGWWGYIGAAIAVACGQWFMSIFLLSYCWYYNLTECWNGIDMKANFQHWTPMLKLAIPGFIMIESEYLSFEILTIMSTYFGTNAIAAQSIISNLGGLIYQLPFATGCVVSTRIANFVGRQAKENAKIATRASFFVANLSGLFNFAVLLLFRYPLSRLFSNEPEVLALSTATMPILAVNQLYDVYNVFGAAILRGQGRQTIGSILNVICYYVIALPISYYLAFNNDMKLNGLWIGCGAGIFLLAAGEMYCVYVSDWDHILEECLKRENDETESIFSHSSEQVSQY